MGYDKEYASLNQFNKMRDYIYPHKDYVADMMKKTKELFSSLNSGNIEIHEKIKGEETIPAVSFDGGMATLFPNELSEIKLIKVSGGTGPQHSHFKFRDYFFHIPTGIFNWPMAFNTPIKKVAKDLIGNFTDEEWVVESLDELGVEKGDFENHLSSLLERRKYKNVEDIFREYLEWFLMVLFVKDNKTDFLIIKDGSLYPSTFIVGKRFVEIFYNWVDKNKVKAVGLVKSSRFLNEENSWGKPIKERARKMAGHSFFKIPPKLENQIDRDSEQNRFERYFISLYNGQAVFECQFSHLINNEECMKILISQATLSHGGSIITNSYAHKKASLSAREAEQLTNLMRGR